MTALTTAEHDRDLRLLTLLHDGTPVSVAGPQVGVDASAAHAIATDYGYPNRRKLANAMASLEDKMRRHRELDDEPLPDPEDVADAMAEQLEAEQPDEPTDTEESDADALRRTAGRVLQLEDQLRNTQLALQTLRAGEAGVATEEQWTQLWLDRMARYVERGKASTWAKLPKAAKQLEEAAATLLQGLDEEAKRAELDAAIAAKRAELHALEEAAGVRRTMTAGGAPAIRGYDPAEVRAWAKANGLDVKPNGRVPAEIVAKWQARTP